MKLLHKTWLRLTSITSQMKESLFWNARRNKYRTLCNQSPSSLNNDVLAAFVRWYAHQTEKSTKHVFDGVEKPLSKVNYSELARYLYELKKRNLKGYENIIAWAEMIVQQYDNWRKVPGNINITPSDTDTPDGTASISSVILHTIHKRTSTRFWKQEPVSESLSRQLLEAGQQAPTSCDKQGWFFAVVHQPSLNEPDMGANNKAILKNAPLIIYIGCRDAFYPERFGPALDVGCAAEAILIAAESFGLGGCCIYQCESFDQSSLCKVLEIPDSVYLYLAICLGYPAEKAVKPPRLPLDLCSTIIHRRIHS